ncbi:MAG TPA: hypothetical protein VEG84_09660 [Thermoanaerobaculia bacterium]|nr:hypothetical protein [Thermoanaerobaculia bacterium]
MDLSRALDPHLLASLFDLIVWRLIKPSVPVIGELTGGGEPMGRVLRLASENVVAIKTVEAVLAVVVGIAAFFFLRLREWARIAVQAVCWLSLAYVVGFALLWTAIWTGRLPASFLDPSLIAAKGSRGGLYAGLAVCAAVAAVIVTAIVSLGSEKVRAAFRTAPVS